MPPVKPMSPQHGMGTGTSWEQALRSWSPSVYHCWGVVDATRNTGRWQVMCMAVLCNNGLCSLYQDTHVWLLIAHGSFGWTSEACPELSETACWAH